jgi:hypothetical protein
MQQRPGGYQPQPGEEYYVYPNPPIEVSSEESIHNDNGFCFILSCPCHEDQELIDELEQQRQNGEVSQDDVERIFTGRTVWT